MLSLILTLICVGIGLWALNKFGSSFISGSILKIINILVIVLVVIWLLNVFGILGRIENVPVPSLK